MQHKAPPIQWLPVFEAAARLLSFKKAAEELCVSPPAVSQQIKVFEDYLQEPLFDRSERRLKLTPAGDYYYQIAKDIIQSHHKGYRNFERTFKNPTLQISVPLFITQELLIPHYLGFRQYSPDTELRINTGNHLVDFDSDDINAAIRFGEGHWPELECRKLCPIDVVFVSSPTYSQQHQLTSKTEFTQSDLESHTLISTNEHFSDWKKLFPNLNPTEKVICDSYFSAVKSAEEGLGITIGMLPVINNWVVNQRLTILGSAVRDSHYGYWLVAPKDSRHKEKIDALYEWLSSLFATSFPEV